MTRVNYDARTIHPNRLPLKGSARPGPVRLEDKTVFSALACPDTGLALHRVGNELVTPDGVRRYPIAREVPRFVSSDLYVGSFSFEWNVHKRTQLDTHRQDSSSEDVFRI